jgi:hypothetical protein
MNFFNQVDVLQDPNSGDIFIFVEYSIRIDATKSTRKIISKEKFALNFKLQLY